MPLQSNTVQLIVAQDISTTGFTSGYFNVTDADLLSVQVNVYNGTAPTGQIQLQCSTQPLPPTVFVTDTDAIINITDNSNILMTIGDVAYNWARVVYNRTSGTGTVDVWISKKILTTT
jgi:hypothetical protein